MVISLPVDFFIVGVTCSPAVKLTHCKTDKKLLWNCPNIQSDWVFSMPFTNTKQREFSMQKHAVVFECSWSKDDMLNLPQMFKFKKNNNNDKVNLIWRFILFFKLNIDRKKLFVCLDVQKILSFSFLILIWKSGTLCFNQEINYCVENSAWRISQLEENGNWN